MASKTASKVRLNNLFGELLMCQMANSTAMKNLDKAKNEFLENLSGFLEKTHSQKKVQDLLTRYIADKEATDMIMARLAKLKDSQKPTG